MKRRILTALLLLLAIALTFTACNFSKKSITSISVVDGTIDTTLKVGESLDTSGIKVLVTYSDGSTEEIGADKLTIGTVDTATAGTKELTVSYEGVEIKVTVTVEEESAPAAPVITGIKIVSGTVPTSIKLGDAYDASKLQVEAIYSDGTKKPVAASELNVTLPNTTAAGSSELVVTYGEFTDKVTVKVNGAVAISVISGTVASELFVGANLNTSNIQATVTLSDGTTVIVDAADLTVGTIDTSTVGDKKLSITYLGFTYEYTVKVIGVTGIKVNQGSVATTVKVFGTLDTSKITAKAIFSNGIERPLVAAELTVEDIDTSTVGEKKLVVKYGDFTDEVTVTVVGVKSMAVVSGTLVNEILKGETIDTSALKVNVTYTDNTTEVVSAEKLTLTVPSTAEAGEKSVVIEYLDGELNAKVNVYYLQSIKVNQGTVATSVMVFGTLDTSKITAKAIYSNGTEKALATSELTVGSINLNTAGTRELTVTYGNLSDKVIITVVGVKSITVAPGTVATEVLVDGTLDLTKIRATVEFTDGTTDVVEAAELTLGAFSTEEAGNKNLAVTYLDKTVQYAVKVCGVASIRVENAPLSFTAGIKPSFDGIKVYAVYSDTNKTELLLTEGYTTDIDSIDINTEGDKTVTVTYSGELGTFSVGVIISTTAPVITGIEFDKITKVFMVGEAVDFASLVSVKVTYSNGATAIKNATAEGVNLTAPTTATAGNYTLTVSYTEGGITLTAAENVKVLPVASFTVTGMPTLINKGEALDTSKVKLNVTYSDGTDTLSAIVTDGFTVSAIDNTVGGDKTVTVTFGGKTADVTVHVKDVVGIELVSKLPESVLYGHSINVSGDTIVKITYTNGAIVEKTVSELGEGVSIDCGSTAATGNAAVTVSYTENGKTVTCEGSVAIVAISSIQVNGMPTLVNKGETLNLAGVTVTVNYANGANEVIDITDAGVTVSDLDNTTGGDKTVTVTYCGVSATANVHVKAVAGITFLAGAFETIRNKYTLSTANVTFEITYTDGTKELKTAFELGSALTFQGLTVDVAADVYTATVTAAYEGCTATTTVNVLQLDSISALNGTVPASVPLNSTLPFERIRLTAIFKDAQGNLYTFLIDNSDALLEIPAFDTTTAGEKALVFNYFGLSTSLHVIVKAIDGISIVDGTVQTTINKGQDVETADIKVMVHYTDGSYVYVDTTDTFLSITHNVNNQVEGTYTLTVNYQGVELKVTITVKDVTSVGSNTIFGTSLPSNLTARESYKNNFKDKTQGYVVGDDNPYIFRLTLLVLDENYELVDTSAGYTSTSQVYLINGDGTKTLVGEEYVGINEANNSFDFTDAAVGKTFEIVTAPAAAPTMTQSQTVTVVDAYNIYSAKELNIVNNTDWDINGTEGEGYLSKLNSTNEVLSANGITRPSNLRGIVFHGNIDIKMSDIPEQNFYTYKGKDGTMKTELLDQNSLYCWSVTPENPTFNVYGNYYNLYSYNLPCVIENGIMNNTDVFSNSEVFMFRTADYVAVQESFTNDGYVSNVYNLAMRDNDPNSNDQSASDRHMRGLIGFKPMMLNFNVYNTNVDAYYLSMVTDSDYTYVNLDKVKFYNAWQGHIFIWNSNSTADWRGQMELPPVANHQSTKINITDSLVAKCGGPVILSQTEDAEYAASANSKADVVIDDKTEIYSYVTGQEAWFVAVGQTSMAGMIMAMNALVSGTAAAQGINASYTTTTKIQGVSTMNLIMLVMGEGLALGDGTVDYDGSCTIGGQTVLQMNDGMNPLLEGYIAATNAMSATGAPVFQSSAGGVAYSDGATGCYQIDFSTGASGYATGNFFQGDYITLNYLGMGILLEYYH